MWGLDRESILAVVLWRNLVPAPAADRSQFIDALGQTHRLGRAGMYAHATIKAAESAQVVKPQSFQKVIVDSAVQEKAIAHPTDSKLLDHARQHLVKLAAEAGPSLRQNYNREAPRLAVQVGRYEHAKQYKRMGASLKKLKTVVGRVWRDVERQLDKIPGALRDKASDLLSKAKRLLAQKQRDKNKLYSLTPQKPSASPRARRGNLMISA